jgi:hypothetical protein
VINFDCPADGTYYTTDNIFHIAKSYWGFPNPLSEISGGKLPHLSASPYVHDTVQWK